MASKNQQEQITTKGAAMSGEITTIMEELKLLGQMWEKMDMVLQAEWKLLLRNDIKRLLKISRMKEELAQGIREREKGLSQMLSCLFPEIDREGERFWEEVSKGLDVKAARQLKLLFGRRDYFRRLCVVTNSRIYHWVRERLGFFSELSGILSGASLKKGPTYGPVKSSSKNEGAASGAFWGSDGASSINSSDLKRGFASYKNLLKETVGNQS